MLRCLALYREGSLLEAQAELKEQGCDRDDESYRRLRFLRETGTNFPPSSPKNSQGREYPLKRNKTQRRLTDGPGEKENRIFQDRLDQRSLAAELP